MTRLTDEEYARHAAQHALYPDGQAPRHDRVTDLRHHGVTDETSLGDHALKVMQDPETKCFRGHEGRECFGNDRLNTMVRTNENNPEMSTVHHNDDPNRTATQRVEESAAAEGSRNNTIYEVREGGSPALEGDRVARPASTKSAGEQQQSATPIQEQTPPGETAPQAAEPAAARGAKQEASSFRERMQAKQEAAEIKKVETPPEPELSQGLSR